MAQHFPRTARDQLHKLSLVEVVLGRAAHRLLLALYAQDGIAEAQVTDLAETRFLYERS